MSREKKSQVDDFTKLRRILDNSSDPSLRYLITKDDYALESVRRRLCGDLYETQPRTDRFFPESKSLEPRVSIHSKTAISPRFMTPPPTIEPPKPLAEFELVSTSIQTKPIPASDVIFADEELFEVEKIDRRIPEFLEVTPRQTILEPEEQDVVMHDEEISLEESNLPEWQPVEEEQTEEAIESSETPAVADVPEFERISITPIPEDEKPIEWGTSRTKEEQIVHTMDGIPVEPAEPSFQKLSKREERAAKKAQRKKERETKKLQKFELKRLKKEKRKEQLTAEEVKPNLQPAEEPPLEAETIEITKAPQINVDYNNFKGIESIDEKTAELLYKNGYFSIENIKDASLDDLVQIRGMKRKLAKQIKKEIEQQIPETNTSEFIPITQKVTKKKEKKKIEDSGEWESSSSKEKTQHSTSLKICTYKEYTLYKRDIRKPDGQRSTIHFFTKSKSSKGHPSTLPEGYRIAINKKTGVPFVKKKR